MEKVHFSFFFLFFSLNPSMSRTISGTDVKYSMYTDDLSAVICQKVFLQKQCT